MGDRDFVYVKGFGHLFHCVGSGMDHLSHGGLDIVRNYFDIWRRFINEFTMTHCFGIAEFWGSQYIWLSLWKLLRECFLPGSGCIMTVVIYKSFSSVSRWWIRVVHVVGNILVQHLCFANWLWVVRFTVEGRLYTLLSLCMFLGGFCKFMFQCWFSLCLLVFHYRVISSSTHNILSHLGDQCFCVIFT